MAANPIPEAVCAINDALIFLRTLPVPAEKQAVVDGIVNPLRAASKSLTAAQQQGQAVACHASPDGKHDEGEDTQSPGWCEWCSEQIGTAPQPTQQGGEEVAVCPNCERPTEIRHCQACGADFINSAPPSAPVGVEQIIATDEAGWALAKRAEIAGAERDSDDNGTWWTLRIEQFKALAQQPAAVDDAMVSEIAKKLRKLRLTEVGGRKESQATTVKECLKAGLGGLYDDEAAEYIVRAVLRYWEVALAARKKGVGCHGSV